MDSTKLLREGKQVAFKTADKYTGVPCGGQGSRKGQPHNKLHSKNYTPNVSVDKR
jgi:hypothetical protein